MKIKKQKAQKVSQKEFKFQDYKNCLEAAQIENKTNHLEKNEMFNQLIRQKHAYGMNKDLVYKKEEIKFNSIIKQYKNV